MQELCTDEILQVPGNGFSVTESHGECLKIYSCISSLINVGLKHDILLQLPLISIIFLHATFRQQRIFFSEHLKIITIF